MTSEEKDKLFREMGMAIKLRMREKGIKSGEVAIKMGVCYESVIAWRNGIQQPKGKNRQNLEKTLDMDLSRFYPSEEVEEDAPPEGCCYPNCDKCIFEDCTYAPLSEMDLEDMEEKLQEYDKKTRNKKLYQRWYYYKNHERIWQQRNELKRQRELENEDRGND